MAVAGCASEGTFPVLIGDDDRVMLSVADHPLRPPRDRARERRRSLRRHRDRRDPRAAHPHPDRRGEGGGEGHRPACGRDRRPHRRHGARGVGASARHDARAAAAVPDVEPDDDVAVPWWEPAVDAAVDPWTDTVLVAGVEVATGTRVRLRPSRRADAHDMFLATWSRPSPACSTTSTASSTSRSPSTTTPPRRRCSPMAATSTSTPTRSSRSDERTRARGRDRQHLPGRRRLRRRGRPTAPAAPDRATACGSRTSASVACTSRTSCSTATTRSCSSTRCRWASAPARSPSWRSDPADADHRGRRRSVLEAHSMTRWSCSTSLAHLGGAVERVLVVGCEPAIARATASACRHRSRAPSTRAIDAIDGVLEELCRTASQATRRKGDPPMIRNLVAVVSARRDRRHRDPLAARHRAVPEDPRDVTGCRGSVPHRARSARRCSSPPRPACIRSIRAPMGSRGSSTWRCRAGVA